MRRRPSYPWLALGAAILSFAGPTAAQRRGTSAPFTGYELALGGSQRVRLGRDNRFRGIAYQVRGLADLVPYAGPVRLRFTRVVEDSEESPAAEPRWLSVVAGADGRFVADLPVPLQSEEVGRPRLLVEVGPSGSARRFEIPVTEESAVEVMLRMDRVLYEAGEVAHVWALLTDAVTQRPLAGERLHFEIGAALGDTLSPREETAVTTEAGVVHLELPIPADTREGSVDVRLYVPGQTRRTMQFRVGTRAWQRLMATVSISPDQVAPTGTATAEVRVTTPSGAPVAEAEVTGRLDGSDTPYAGRTGPDGRVTFTLQAPAFLVHQTGTLGLVVQARHPAHGSAAASGHLRLAVPLALEIEVVAAHGGLVPEVDEALFVRLRDGAGNPPPRGTEVRVEGPIFPSGSVTATTDDNGLAAVTARAPVGVASGGFGELPLTSVVVSVGGAVERVARLTVPILRETAISQRLDRVVVEPGEVVDVRLARRPSARRRSAIVELLDGAGRSLAAHPVGPGTQRVRLRMPDDYLGVLAIRTRAVDGDESLTSVGVIDRLIVRPPRPDFVRVEAERPRWVVGETASVHLRSLPRGPRSFAAVLVRDLSAHSGEQPFQRTFLSGAFDRAILDPAAEGAERLARAALAADPLVDPAPYVVPSLVDALSLPNLDGGTGAALARGDLRDPFPMSRELSRRGVANAMRAAEETLAVALAEGTVDEVSIGRGTARRFRPDLLAAAPAPGEGLHTPEFQTLGGQPATPAILEASDASFNFHSVARRVARARLVRLWVVLAHYLDPGDEATPAQRRASREPSDRWLPRMVEAGLIERQELDDPWGGRFVIRPTRSPVVVVSERATGLELVSPGPDGRVGTRDDVRDPFERVVPAATPYAVASGEDELMRRLAVLSPLEATLSAIRESYQRVTVEMSEEEIGDAVFGGISGESYGMGGLGLSGTGRGGGGTGYGSIGAGSVGRIGRAPMVRVGRASVSGLGGVLRERFPPTLLFVPTIELDPSGTTTVPIALADTVTTYLVETIVWREDGWVWSDRTEIEVDRDIVVAAPVPPTGHRGDTLRLPLRVSNRSASARTVTLRLLGDAGLGISDSEVQTVDLPAGGSARVPVSVRLGRVGRGSLTVVATAANGDALDAVRRPIQVLPLARRARAVADFLGDGRGGVSLAVPRDARAGTGGLRIVVAEALFAPLNAGSPWALWAPSGRSGAVRGFDLRGVPDAGSSPAVQRAIALSTRYRDEAVADEDIVADVAELTALIEQAGGAGGRSPSIQGGAWSVRAAALLALSPVAREPSRGRGAPEVGLLIERLRRAVAAGALGASDDPFRWATAAAALGWSARRHRGGAVGELTRRSRRHVISVGDDRWLATDGARPVRSTLLLAMAELSLGHRQVALGYLATVGRWSTLGHALAEDERALARALLGRLLTRPRQGESGGRDVQPLATVVIDGDERRVPLVGGVAELEVPTLGRPGRHAVSVEVPGAAPVWLEATARYRLPWDRPSGQPGPVVVAIEGDVGRVDEVSEFEVVARNSSPRVIPRSVVELELPTGAEILAADLQALTRRGLAADHGEGVLRLVLPPLLPGAEGRYSFSLRFSVEGTLRGFGAAAWAEDRPEAVTVVLPRTMTLRREGP